MSHTIYIHNKSSHAQEFEVHGWNNNHNITVPAHGKSEIRAPSKSSGAIIALHDGHEGEQAEITKDGFSGNDFFDLSNIVGAGGNMTVVQVGQPKTIKGHPEFMQALNSAWQKADQNTKNKVKRSLHFDASGKITRMDGPKDNHDLEVFCRTFDKVSYLGVGATKDSKGNPIDNAQSSAGVGNRDILVTYNDGDARPSKDENPVNKSAAALAPPMMAESVQSVSNIFLAQTDFHITAAAAAPKAVQGDKDNGKDAGILLTNKSKTDETYYFYDNYWNGNGTAGANFDHPLKSTHVPAGKTSFVSLPTTFKGRVQRGKLIPATWVEFQLDASNDHKAHGDISVQQGNDGPATIRATDGSNRSNGFTTPIHAEKAAYQKRVDGKEVIASTMGNWLGGPNQAAIRAQQGIKTMAYVTGGSGVPDVASANKRFAVDFY